MTTARREASIAFAAQLIALASAILTQSCLAWALGQEGRGSYAVCMTVGSLLGLFFVPGTDRAAQYFLVSKKLSMSEATSGALYFVAIASILGLLAGLVAIDSGIPFLHKASTTDVLFSMAVLVPLGLLSVTLELQLSAQREFGAIALFTGVQALISLAVVLLLTSAFDLGVTGGLIAAAIASLTVCSLYWWRLRHRQGFSLQRVGSGTLVGLFSYGRRYYLARIGHQLDLGAGVLVLGTIGSRADVGLFAAVSALVMRVLMLSTTIESVLLPRFAQDDERRLERLTTACRVAGWLTLLSCIPLVVLAFWIVVVLLSPEFSGGRVVIWTLVPGVIALGFAGCLMTYFRITDRPQVCSLAVWAGLLAGTLSMIFLYPRFGLAGAGAASGMGLLARALVLLAAFKGATGVSPLALFALPQNVIAGLLPALKR